MIVAVVADRTFGMSSVLFIGGFAVEECPMARAFHHQGGVCAYMPSVCCMVGEVGILTTWGTMLQNHPTSMQRSGIPSLHNKGKSRVE